MGRGRTCRVWPHDVRNHRHRQRVNNLIRISAYMSWISKYSPAPKRRNPTLYALFSYRQIFQSFWTGASHSTSCSPFLADLVASFSTDSSKWLLGVFKRSFTTGFVSFEERR